MPVQMTPAHVELEIARLSEVLETKTNEYARLAREAAVAEVRHKTARAKALLASTGRSQDLREAEADDATAEEHMGRKVAEAVADACKESMRTTRTQLDALRTLDASLREQVSR